jgi:phenylalanyl-tRNA synthetase beta subunit
MNTTKQYALFLQQNPHMTQEYAMQLLKKTRLQIKYIERVAGVRLKTDKINDIDTVIVWFALNVTKPNLKNACYFIKKQLGIEISAYTLKQKLAKFGLLMQKIKTQQTYYVNKFAVEYL